MMDSRVHEGWKGYAADGGGMGEKLIASLPQFLKRLDESGTPSP